MLRIVRNFHILKSQRLVDARKYREAETVVKKLLEHYEDSMALRVFLADITLFQGEKKSALEMYEAAVLRLRNCPLKGKEDQRYLVAYSNFRIEAIKYSLAGKEFSSSVEFAKIIDSIEASKSLKRLLPIPI